MRRSLPLLLSATIALTLASLQVQALAAGPRVLLVGSWNGVKGQYKSIQVAVNAAHPGDWILVGPGDYHEKGGNNAQRPAGVFIRTGGIHLRGMDRNSVIVDGTLASSAGACSGAARDQDLGPVATGGPAGRSGRISPAHCSTPHSTMKPSRRATA